jgi:hypothetical protein
VLAQIEPLWSAPLHAVQGVKKCLTAVNYTCPPTRKALTIS